MGVMKMNEKERTRKAIFEMVKQKRITLVQASIQCGLSYRQTQRIYHRYKEEGDAGLIHQSRDQRSNRKHPHQESIIARYIERYEGFGPTLACEYLLEDGYDVNRETLRLWLLSHDLWKKKHKRTPYRKRREPKAQFGELVQIDGSIHDWFGIDKNDCLLNMVDDATSKTLSMLDSGETTRVVFLGLWKWIKRYGIPLSIYVDLKTVYISPKDTNFSHVQVACDKLGIRIIKARSPQAKGRVERNHAVYQDRFVKELHLRQIKTIDEANAVLDSGFIDNLNRKFEKIAKNPESAHRPLGDIDLNQVFCWEYKRQIQHDWTFSFSGKYFQVEKEYGSHVKPKDIINVRKHLDGTVSAWYKDNKLTVRVIPKRTKAVQQVQSIKPKTIVTKRVTNGSSWHESNAFIFLPDTPTSKTTLRKRHI